MIPDPGRWRFGLQTHPQAINGPLPHLGEHPSRFVIAVSRAAFQRPHAGRTRHHLLCSPVGLTSRPDSEGPHMGKANREHRRMKSEARKQSQAGRVQGSGFFLGDALDDARGPAFDQPLPPPPPTEEQVSFLVTHALSAACQNQPIVFARCAAELSATDQPNWQKTVAKALDWTLRTFLNRLWEDGWQPADLLRYAERKLDASQHRLLRAGMAAELAGYAQATVDPRWTAQCAEGKVSISVGSFTDRRPGLRRGPPGWMGRCRDDRAHTPAHADPPTAVGSSPAEARHRHADGVRPAPHGGRAHPDPGASLSSES